MSKDRNHGLWISRNPYAYDYYVDDVELFDETADSASIETKATNSAERIEASSNLIDTQSKNVDISDLHKFRKDSVTKVTGVEFSTDNRKAHPYVYIDGNDSIAETSLKDISKAVNSNKKIEQKTRELQLNIWNNRDLIWPEGVPKDPVEMLDPKVAIKLIGYDFEDAEFLGDYSKRESEVAGIIDRNAKCISISRQFTPQIRRFTAAHELGHALLHNEVSGHRDRPVDGSGHKRMGIEVEADKFATYFLMPEKLVRKYFKEIFLTGNFKLTEDTAFALNPGNPNELLISCKNPRVLSRIFAKTECYNGSHVRSLAERFHVSVETMAIRIEELKLFKL